MGRKKIKALNQASLEALHTGSLMSRRASLLACEQSLEMSDQDEDTTAEEGIIEFKSDPAWQQAYSDLKHTLATRENWPPTKKRK